jgi:hypothetical protein
MSNRSPSADTSAGHQPAGAPGNRTPRRVQWVDENETTGRTRDCGLEGDVVSTHELDEAGLDVRGVQFPLTILLTSSSAPSRPPSTRSLMLLNVIAQTPHYLFPPHRRLPSHPVLHHHV